MVFRVCVCQIPVVLFCALGFIGDGAYGGDLEREARSKAEQYILGEKFALENYLMITDILVATPPDAEFLFESRGSMAFFRRENTTLSYVDWQPKVMDDLRIGKARAEMIPFASLDSLQELVVDGRSFIAKNDQLQFLDPSVPQNYYSGDAAVVLPFDWPLHSFATFSRSGAHELGKTTFEKKICFLAIEGNGELVSYWALPEKGMGYAKVCFKEDLIIRKEVIWMKSMTKTTDIDVNSKEHRRSDIVKTKWTRFDDQDVPEEVNSVFTLNSVRNPRVYELSAKLKYFSATSPEYKKHSSEVDRLLKLRQNK